MFDGVQPYATFEEQDQYGLREPVADLDAGLAWWTTHGLELPADATVIKLEVSLLTTGHGTSAWYVQVHWRRPTTTHKEANANV